jgi:putative spermidine/putrescine transport system ATP-binding protein
MQLELKEIQRRVGVTVIYVTHDQEEAFTLSDRIAILRGGKLEQVGVPGDLYHHPQSEFVAQFVGEATLVPGTVQEASRGAVALRHKSGLIFRGSTLHDVSAGSPATLVLRPERLQVRDIRVPENENAIKGTIEKIADLGNAFKVWVRVDELVVLAQLPQTPETARLSPGENVVLEWDPASASLLP